MPDRPDLLLDTAGGGRPTIETVAKEVGVSISTVSRALRHHPLVSAETTKKVLEAAERLGYTPNPYVSALMSHLRNARPIPYQATIALLDTLPDPEAWKQFSVQKKFFSGSLRRAEQMGYRLERFWVFDKGLTKTNLTRILVSRGIRGIVIPPLRDYSTKGDELPVNFEEFACVTLGTKVVDPGFHFATNDQYVTGQLAHDRLLDLGYKRVGMAIPEYVECIVERRFSAGFRNALERRGIVSSPDSIFRYDRSTGQKELPKWLKKFKPDAICCTFTEVRDWVEALHIPVPQEMGFASLDWDEEYGEWSGVDQESGRVGAAAIDLLVQLIQRNELGAPDHPFGLTIEGSWVPGNTSPARVS